LDTAASPRQDLRGVLLLPAAGFVPAASLAGPVVLADTPVALVGILPAVAALAAMVAADTPAADTAEPRFAD
jgi:hypothetical protein